MPRRLTPPRRRVELALLAAGIILRLPAFTRPVLSDDEAIYAATAAAMARGDQLYRDVVDHKPPAIYALYRAGQALLGGGDAQGAHLLVLLAVLATAALLWRLGARATGAGAGAPLSMTAITDEQMGAGSLRRETGSYAVAAATAGLFLIFSTTWHDYDALAANCELFLLLPQSWAALLLFDSLAFPLPPPPVDDQRAAPRRGPWAAPLRAGTVARHLGIGFLIGLSALCKYQGLTFLGVSAGLLGWAVLAGRLTTLEAIAALVAQLFASLVPAALYLAWAAAHDSAQATLYWFTFNFSYVGAGLQGTLALRRALWRLALVGGVAVVPYALGARAALTTARSIWRAAWPSRPPVAATSRPGRGGFAARWAVVAPGPLLGTLWLLTSAIAVAAGGRFFGHYFHLLLPPLCLLAAPAVAEAWRVGGVRRNALCLFCLVPALVFFSLASWARPLAEAADERPPPYASVVERITALSAPEDRLFVWGNSPQLYLLSQRPLGSRFTFCNYMTGESPGTPTETGVWNADRSSLPAAWDMLFSDLEQRRPLLFVDAAAAGWDGYDKFPLARYPRLGAYVATHYDRRDVVSGVVIYTRRDRGQRTPPH